MVATRSTGIAIFVEYGAQTYAVKVWLVSSMFGVVAAGRIHGLPWKLEPTACAGCVGGRTTCHSRVAANAC